MHQMQMHTEANGTSTPDKAQRLNNLRLNNFYSTVPALAERATAAKWARAEAAAVRTCIHPSLRANVAHDASCVAYSSKAAALETQVRSCQKYQIASTGDRRTDQQLQKNLRRTVPAANMLG